MTWILVLLDTIDPMVRHDVFKKMGRLAGSVSPYRARKSCFP